jgi:hypothetical protein
LSRRAVAKRARVCRDTIERYEVDPRLVKDERCRRLCERWYEQQEQQLREEHRTAQLDAEGYFDDPPESFRMIVDEALPATVRSQRAA